MKFVIEKSNYIRSGGRGMHKYVKRTGTPGNYKYWYKLPDGGLGTISDEHQEQGRRDHARRLMIAHLKGKTNLGERARDIQAEVARRTGSDRDLRNIWRNFQGERGGVPRVDRAGYDEEHLQEAYGEAHSAEHPAHDDEHQWHTPESATSAFEASAEQDREDGADGSSEPTPVVPSSPHSEMQSQLDELGFEPYNIPSGNPDIDGWKDPNGYIIQRHRAFGSSRSEQWAFGKEENGTVSIISGPHDNLSAVVDAYTNRIDEAIPTSKKKKKKAKKKAKKVTKKVAKKTSKKVTKKITKESFAQMSDDEVANLSDAELESFLSQEHGVSLGAKEREAKESARRIEEAKRALRSATPELSDEQINKMLGIGDIKKSFVSRKNKKHVKFIVKGGPGSGRHRSLASHGVVITESRRKNLAEQKKKYEAKKELDAGRSDDYYKFRMAGGKVTNKPKFNESDNAPKKEPRPVVGTVSGGSGKMKPGQGHRDYLRRIGAIGKSEKFVVKKDTE